ncbi:monooxygenase [Saccharothrix sp. NRRL B-16348]|uniref:FAD-dependent oxidoreductase n=1 Tax=Saccharothrix sp. NRRL B-16348 TaxID=1415542 RepID=UPI0006AE4C6B|nr:NAD(P)/FAD-dependent oxidoreductase [Saccharothrix sp. NRRL B-16348]KOX21741.1 monooxygenase [Saccharothrix sp. NRRL B-16348]
MTLPETVDVVVSGAGAGGLAAARALGATGLRVLVLDRRRTPAPTAKGEILQPGAVRVLDDWGALDDLRAADARPVDRLAIRDGDGTALLAVEYGALPGPYRQVLCASYEDLCAAITRSLPDTVEIVRGVRVGGVLRDGGRVAGVAADGGEVRARLVVAADGMSSALRKDAGITVDRDEYPHRLLAFDVADVDVPGEVTAYRTARGLRLVYPLPGRRCRLYVQVAPDEFRATGLAELGRWVDGVLAEVPALAPLAPALEASLHRRQLFGVSRLRAGRLAVPGLALVGEAAHAVHPMAAQGVNSSLADAEALAEALGEALGDGDPAVDEALAAYEAARRPSLDHIAQVSHNAARMITALSGAPRLLGARMMRRTAANPRLLRRTAGNMSGTDVRPLTFVDRLYQLGVLADRRAHDPHAVDPRGSEVR